MRHKKRGRVLGRSPSHRRALYRNLASALFLTERPEEELDMNLPKVKGRIVTTLAKAKEIRPLVEKCITVAKKGRAVELAANEQFGPPTEKRGARQSRKQATRSSEWVAWRKSEKHSQWVAAMAPAVAARRKLLQMLGDKGAVRIAMSELADRFMDRNGGYTRIMRLATPRLGDAGTRAILEFVGKNDRVAKSSEKPDFGTEDSNVSDSAE
ncbi:MAG: 50S ribosomal protein L17 [Planctomycetales bacterium]|nr:50S ribosomal protein L17 [Planctomycetales bacterium]